METRFSYALVGMFVLALGAAAVALVLWLSTGRYEQKQYDTYLVNMTDSVSGLNVNAPVKYRGVDIGRVRAIGLAPDNPEVVRLLLDIQHGTPIRADTVAVLTAQGLTGIAFINLTGGSRAAPLLHPHPGEKYPLIKAGPSLLSRLDEGVSGLLLQMDRLTRDARDLINPDNRKALSATLANIEKLTNELSRNDALQQTLNNTSRAMQEVGKAAADLPQLMAELRAAAKEIHAAAQAVRRTAEQTGQVVSQGVGGEMLPQTAALVHELRRLTTSARRLIERLDEQPNMLLYGPLDQKPGPGEKP